MLNDCIYLVWRPQDCQSTLDAIQKEINNGNLQKNIFDAIRWVLGSGQGSAGANPPQSFQAYILEYITFFDDDMSPECNDYTWAVWADWWSDQPLLTVALRQKLNDMTRKVNAVIKAAVTELQGRQYSRIISYSKCFIW